MISERNINYSNRDFSGLKKQLIEFAKNYFPDTYTDFSPTSPGMMFIEMAAYVGDILSFYQDQQLQETFLQYAQNPANLYALAYMMGYRPKMTTVSTTTLTAYQQIDSDPANSYKPNWNQVYRIGEGAEILSDIQGNQPFLTEDPVDFGFSSSMDPTEVTPLYEEGNENEDQPDYYLLAKKVKAYSGQIKTTTRTFGNYQKYPTVEIEDTNIVGIYSIKEVGTNDNDTWVEVPFLGQDTIFDSTLNTGDNADTVPYILTLKKVPKRFVTRFNNKGNLEIQFGAGMYADDADEVNFLPDPLSSLQADPQEMASNKYDIAYDPSNFLFSKSYGLAPTNMTLEIKYIVSNGVQSNVPANTITLKGNMDVTPRTGTYDETTLSFNNEEPAVGGRDGDSLEELKQNSLRAFAEQKRVVTLQDYSVRALAMPPKFGAVAKVYAIKDSLMSGDEKDPLNISLYILGYDPEGHLTVTNNLLKENLRTYLSEYTMLTDTVDIRDAFIINVGVYYDIVLRQGFNSTEVLLECSRVAQDFFSLKKRSINETINLIELQNLLNQVNGVQVVKDLGVTNKVGTANGKSYSEYSYDIQAATRNGIVYPSYDLSIFEVKYPEIDIEGRIVTL